MIEYIFLVVFFVIAIVEVSAEYKNNEKIEYLTKPLLMSLLILFYDVMSLVTNSISSSKLPNELS